MKVLFLRLVVNGLVDGGYVDKTESTPDSCLKVIYMDGNVKFYPLTSIEKIELEVRNYPR